MKLSERARRRNAKILAWGGWTGAFILTVATVMRLIPRTSGTVVVLLIGIAVAASLAQSRMRLTDAIATVYEAGLRQGVEISRSRRGDQPPEA